MPNLIPPRSSQPAVPLTSSRLPAARPDTPPAANIKPVNLQAQPIKQHRSTPQGSAAASVDLNLQPGGAVTRETLMAAIRADNGRGGLAPLLSNSAKRQTFENIADICIRVGQKEGVDPRILFAMAMQESDCGLNTRHNSSAQGVTGMKPSSAPDQSARNRLSNPEVCLTQTAKYLKSSLVRELNARGHQVSAADIAPGAHTEGTQKLLLAYRFGAGGVNTKLRSASLQQLVTSTDYKNVFRHMKNMGL